MKSILRLAMCLTLASCANLAPPNMDPIPIQLPPSSSRFVRDTLILTVSSSTGSLHGHPFQSSLASTMRTAFPAAVILESTEDTTAPRRVFITATIVGYGPSWEDGRWIGHTGIDLLVFDHRVSAGRHLESFIRTSSSSGLLNRGNKTIGDVSRASFDSASRAVVAFLDSLDDPRSRETLRSTAEVSEAEYAPYFASTGNASLAGRAFISSKGGKENFAKGQPVALDPATSSARRWYQQFGMACDAFDPSASPDDLFRRAHRETVTDAGGNFTFTGVPPGTYFVQTRVLWDAPDPNDLFHTITKQYALVSSTVALKEGEQKQIALSQTGNAYKRCPSLVR
jgi:hypothetical protein